MKTKKSSPVKVNVITLGCSKNLVDSEVLMSQFDRNTFQMSHDSAQVDHDVVIINTCGFINDAKQESVDTILKVVAAKKQGLVKKILVTGCLSERYYNDLKKEIPEVDAYFGVNNFKAVLENLGIDFKRELIGERKLTTPSHYAYLKIAEGCDRICSFCAIPLIRGKQVSRSIEDIMKEASYLAEHGVKEIILIAQELTFYGVDIYKKRKLAFLLEQLSAIPGIEWIRLQYSYPAAFPFDVIEVMRDHSNICNYLDMPLQHANNRILRSMKRGTTKEQVYQLLEKVRKEIPAIALRTTFIVGYPGEIEEEFGELLEFASTVQFDRIGIFKYSHEESTSAYALKDDVSAKTKQARYDRLMEMQFDISLQKNTALIGQNLKVLIDRREGEFFVGRTEFDSPEVDNEVLIEANGRENIIGNFHRVKIVKAEPYDLFGEFDD